VRTSATLKVALLTGFEAVVVMHAPGSSTVFENPSDRRLSASPVVFTTGIRIHFEDGVGSTHRPKSSNDLME